MKNMSNSFERMIKNKIENLENLRGQAHTVSVLQEVLDEARELPEIGVFWCADDIIDRATERNMEVTEEQALTILDNMKRRHDCNIGINWDVIDVHIDNLIYELDK